MEILTKNQFMKFISKSNRKRVQKVLKRKSLNSGHKITANGVSNPLRKLPPSLLSTPFQNFIANPRPFIATKDCKEQFTP